MEQGQTQTDRATGQGFHGPSSGARSDGRNVVDLLKDLRDETSLLVRQEIALVKAEMAEKGRVYARNSAYLVIGAAVGYAALLFLLLAATYGLTVALNAAGVSVTVSTWLAPLIVGVVVGAIGYAFIQKGISTLKHEKPTPEKTVQSLQEHKAWLKHKLA